VINTALISFSYFLSWSRWRTQSSANSDP